MAERYDLKVVPGKIPISDLRIECVSENDGQFRRRDLELPAEQYRPRGLSEPAGQALVQQSKKTQLPKIFNHFHFSGTQIASAFADTGTQREFQFSHFPRPKYLFVRVVVRVELPVRGLPLNPGMQVYRDPAFVSGQLVYPHYFRDPFRPHRIAGRCERIGDK